MADKDHVGSALCDCPKCKGGILDEEADRLEELASGLTPFLAMSMPERLAKGTRIDQLNWCAMIIGAAYGRLQAEFAKEYIRVNLPDTPEEARGFLYQHAVGQQVHHVVQAMTASVAEEVKKAHPEAVPPSLVLMETGRLMGAAHGVVEKLVARLRGDEDEEGAVEKPPLLN